MTTVSIPTATQTWRVLVIDDSPEDRAEIRRLLLLGSARQYQFVETSTGLAGVAGVRAVLNTNKLPDCVVLDFNLPDMDAVAVLAALIGPDGLTPCPVVIVTVAVGIEQTRAVLRAGAQDFLCKGSMTPESLTRAVESATERWAMAREQREQKAIVNTSEERLRLAIAGSDLGTWHWDILNGTLDWSERCLEIFGIPPRTAMSYAKFLASLHPEDRARADDAVQHALQHGSEYRIEFRSVWPDGSVHWALSTGRAYHDLAGVSTRMEGIALDITQLKRSEEARHELARNYRALAEASFEMPYRMSADWSTMLPLDGREMLASSDRPLTDWGWMAQYLPSDEQARVRQSINDAIAEKKLFEMEHRVLRLDGSIGWVHSRSVPILDENQAVVEWFGVVSDITELKRAEKALLDNERNYRALATASSEIAYRMSADWSTMLPLDGRQLVPSSDQPVDDWTWMDRNLPPDEHARVRQAISEAIARKSLFELEHRVRRPDGSVGWTLSRAVPILDENEAVTAWFGAAIDISARKQAEEAQRLLASIVENSRDFIGISDTSGNPLYGNRAAMELVGVTDLEHLRRSRFIDYFIPEHRQLVEEVVWPAVATDGRWTGELTMQHFVTGAKIPVWHDLFRVDDPLTGLPINFATITRDLTESKRIEATLRESQERFNNIANAAPAMLWVTKPDATLDFVSRGWNVYTGQTEAESFGIDGFGWLQVIHPDDRERSEKVFLDASLKFEPFSLDCRIRRADGEYRWAIDSGRPHTDAKGQFVGYVGSVIDVHDRKQVEATLRTSEGMLRLALRDTGIVVYTTDADLRYNWIHNSNPAFRPEDLVGRRDEDLLPAEQAAPLTAIKRRVLDTGVGETGEVGIEVGGRHYVYNLVVEPSRDPDGRIVGVTAAAMDITATKKAEEQLRLLAAELTEADRRKDVFLATLAHELRNPLAPIRAGLHLIKLAGNSPDVVKNSLGIIERQVGQLNHLINDLMDVSRISKGKIVLKKTRLLAADVVQDAIDTSRPLIEERGHHLVVEVPPEPLYVNADRTRLVQVFSNLLNNAAKYTNTGGRIKLTVERHNGELIVAVEDNGVGIPGHMLTSVFEMFSQVDGSLEKSQGGLGIGLNIAKRLAEMHDGSIVAESAGHGAGSRFVVRLPLALSLHAEQRDEETKSVTAPARRRILVVDDNKDAANSLALVLNIMGHESQIAHDGLEALEVAALFRPDLVLLDLGMPKLNGYDAARRIREQPWGKAMVLVALSGWGQDEDKRKSHEAGFDAHMVKPIDPAALDEFLDGLKTSVA